MSGAHRLLSPPEMAPAVGFAHAVAAASGRLVSVAGQVAADASGAVVGATLLEQLDTTLGNVVGALRAAGARPEDVVFMQLFTTAMGEYRRSRAEIGRVYRRHFARHYPAMALVAVSELVDPAALVEVVATAVVPEQRAQT